MMFAKDEGFEDEGYDRMKAGLLLLLFGGGELNVEILREVCCSFLAACKHGEPNDNGHCLLVASVRDDDIDNDGNYDDNDKLKGYALMRDGDSRSGGSSSLIKG